MTVRVRVERGGGERHLLHTVPSLHGAPWASPTAERVAGYARARGHVASAALGLDARACARSGRARHSPQCQHMTHASRSAAPPTPRSARRGARASTRATQKKAHVAWTALDLERERGLPGRAVLRARRRVRPRARHRGALPTSLPLMVNKKSSGQPKKKFQNFPSPHNTIPRAASATVPPLPASSRTSVQRVLTRLWDGPGHDNGWAAAA